jgi:glycosyltransferase involved in cell wall biosynthesis
MSSRPDISVVMSVYNEAASLRGSLESILSQEGVALELIVIDDGSTDVSGAILDEFAANDGRIKIIRQDNMGLTKALARGCLEASGEYIARQDAGDVSLPRRLEKQLSCMTSHSDAALVSCGTRFVGPRGEHLYDSILDDGEAVHGLLTLDIGAIRGPSHHGSTLFSASLYRKVGGYRPSFYFAQDLDLWIRLTEHGTHIAMREVLYKAHVTAGAISSVFRKEQIRTTQIILECARLRQSGLNEEAAMKKAMAVKPVAGRRLSRLDYARAFYFIGAVLRKKDDRGADYYFKQALLKFPLHLKSAVRLFLG